MIMKIDGMKGKSNNDMKRLMDDEKFKNFLMKRIIELGMDTRMD